MGISALRNSPYKAFISRKNDEKQNWVFSARLEPVRHWHSAENSWGFLANQNLQIVMAHPVCSTPFEGLIRKPRLTPVVFNQVRQGSI